jgi:hypothetical protein
MCSREQDRLIPWANRAAANFDECSWPALAPFAPGSPNHAPDLASKPCSRPLNFPNHNRKKLPHGTLRLDMACINQHFSRNNSNLDYEEDQSCDSDDDESTSTPPSSRDINSGIDIAAIKSAKKVEHSVAHRVEAERSILALVVDDDYLIGGLEGGDIVVCEFSGDSHSEVSIQVQRTLADCLR